MKKYYYSLIAATAMLFATTSCSQDEELVQQGSSDVTTFKVELEGASGSRAAGDGSTVDVLYYEVHQGNKIVLDDKKAILDGSGTVSLELPLLKGENYNIIFWAQKSSAEIYGNGNLTNITVDYSKANANMEEYDAFFNALKDFKADNKVTTVQLRRPFAQLRIGTTEADWQEAIKMIDANNDPVTESKITLTGLATKFNALTGDAAFTNETDKEAKVEFKKAILLKEEQKDANGNVMTDANGDPILTVEKFALKGTDYRYLSMNYLLVPGKKDPQDLNPHVPAGENEVVKTITDLAATFYRGTTELFTLNIDNVPIQRNYRTNIYGTLLAQEKTFNIEVVEGFEEKEYNKELTSVNTSDELNTLLQNSDGEDLVFDLQGGRAARKYTVDVTSWQTLAWGGENTKTITINANGNEIEFNLKGSDWSNVTMKNLNGKLIINNAILSSTGYNSGHWKRNLTHFACNVEFNDVTVNGTGIGVKNDAVLNNVIINQIAGNYSFWVWANGKTVNVDKLTVNTPEGRAIKIADEDAEGGLVTLNVSNSKFTTKEKAAILVTSKDGANITLSNIDLSGVKADGFNAVWVDEDRKESYDKVTVEGGFKAQEGDTQTENPFKVEDGTVTLPAGTFVVPGDVAKGVTIEGAADGTTVLDMTGKIYSGKEALTFKNLTVKLDNQIYVGIQQSKDLVYENCVIDGTIMLYANATFKKCTFNVEDDNYNVWTYGSSNATFEECTFNCDGKSVLVYNEGYNGSVVTMNKCTFKATADVEGKAAVEIDSSLLKEGQEYVVNLNECTAEGFGKGSVSNNTLFNPKKGSKATINVNGAKAVWSAETLKAAIAAANNTAFTDIVLSDGTYTGAFDIDGKSVKLKALNKHQATIDGLVHGLDFSHVTLQGLILTNATPAASGSARHNADYYCLGAYVTDFVIEDCVFNVSNDGDAKGKGAINIYANRSDYELYDGFDLTIKNTVFNCNGERPVRGKTNSWIEGCTFNDQHRYAIQVQGNSQLSSETVKFVNNTIVNPCKTSGEAFAAGVSISKSQLIENAEFIISGNTIQSDKFDDLKFVYDNNANVKITTCTLNGQTITEGQCVMVDDETNEVLAEAIYTVAGNEYTLLNAKGLFWFANQVNVAGNKFSGKTVKLGADIDLENAAWTPVGQTGATQFKGTFDGQDKTISNLNIDATAQTGGSYSSGLFGWLNAAYVKNVKVANATVKGNHNVAVIAGYLETAGCTVENCHVSGAAVECHHENADACGDKAGVIVGHAGNAGVVVKNCTAKNSTVKAGRDAGQIAGAAKEANVTGCSASNVTVSKLDGCTDSGAGKNIRNEVIGRLL